MSVELPPSGIPSWFGPADRPIFGWLHVPSDGRASSAVVLCPPLVREQTITYQSFRRLAEQLAELGMVAVRFDYDGAGDSAGSDRDPDRLEAWLASIEHAIELARSTGVDQIGLVGIRIGANLAAKVAERIGALHSLVLWEPCWSGRGFLREQRAVSLLRFGDEGPGAHPGELPGFRFDLRTVEDLKSLGLSPVGVHVAHRALVLSPPGFAPPTQAVQELRSATVEWEEAPEPLTLHDVEVGLRQMPVTTIDRIAAWLSQAHSGRREPVNAAGVVGARSINLTSAEKTITERCRRLGPHGLFGIETVPPGKLAIDAPTILMPNVSIDAHPGPNRLWVELARSLAARGLRSIRFDLSGLGDSPPRPGQPAQLVYAPHALDDLLDAARAASPDDPANVVLVGQCSGGYLSLEGALALSARGVCAINPAFRFAPPEMEAGPMDPRRRFCQPISPAVRVYRAIPILAVRRAMHSIAWRLVNRLGSADSPGVWFGKLAEAGVDAFCIGGEDELRPLFAGNRRRRSSLHASGKYRLEIIPELDHGMLYSPQREAVFAAVAEHLVDRFSSKGGPSSAPSVPNHMARAVHLDPVQTSNLVGGRQ